MPQYTLRYLLNLSEQELKQIAKNDRDKLISIARQAGGMASSARNRAVKAFEKRDWQPRVYSSGEWEKYNFLQFSNRNINEYKEVKTSKILNFVNDTLQFLGYQTRTVSGQEKILEKTLKRTVGEDIKSSVDAKYILSNKVLAKEFWKILSMLESGGLVSGEYKYESEVLRQQKGFTNKLQELVLKTMIEDGTYDKANIDPNLSASEDEYAYRIINLLSGDIEREYQKRQEENEDLLGGLTISRRL